MLSKPHTRRPLAAALALAVSAALLAAALSAALAPPARPALAQTGGGYSLTWNTVAGGGLTYSTGGGYRLGGTLGQPAAGQASGGAFTLRSGFWVFDAWAEIFLPLVQR